MAPAALKNTADPPGASAVSQNGVYTESSAIEPTTSRLTSHPIRGADPQEVEAVGEHLAHRRRQHQARRLLGLAEHAVLVVPGVRQAGEPFKVAGDAVRLERLSRACDDARERGNLRSEEHTSELQSRLHLVCRLLLEKKKKKKKNMP